MFWTGNPDDDRIKKLEKDNREIINKISQLENLLKKKSSDFENEAREASENAVAHEKVGEEARNAINSYLTDVEDKVGQINSKHVLFQELLQQIEDDSRVTKEHTEAITKSFETISEYEIKAIENAKAIEDLLEDKDVWDERILKIDEILNRANDYDSKLATLNKGIVDRKKEIDTVYYEILGYTEENKETGVEEEFPGLKDKLERAYNELEANIESVEKEVEAIRLTTTQNYESFSSSKERQYIETIEKWQNEHNSIVSQINELLPNALTAGLSFAYKEKKDTEVLEYKDLSNTFKNAIWGLIAISTIPIAVSIYSIIDEVSLHEVLLRIPRLVLAILPLYIPVLWVAYSSNKKRNLSKRLVEEYSHKETLSKTYEGLSKQINDIADETVSTDLRINLLYNILQVNSENPGKLISDYNNSDHPLMDALDKSIRLTNAVSRLSKIPGFTKLASTLGKKAEDVVRIQSEKAETGLNAISVEDNK